MVQTDSIQSTFLEQIKNKLAPHLSFADEMAELLNISRDSAYRRIRGETILSLDEVRLLTNHYGISLDAFISPAKDRVSFQLKALETDDFSFEKWLKSFLDNLEIFLASPEKEKELIYDAKDLPIFHYFQFPRLSAFKMYFWMKYFARDAKFNSGKFDPKRVDNKLLSMGEKIWELYSRIPCTEIITYELLTITLRQIEYAHDCGMFTDPHEAAALCDDCLLLSNHLKLQAEIGFKQTFGSTEQGAKYELYLNEVLIGANTAMFKLDTRRIVFITPNNFDLLTTTHESFCKITEDHIHNLIDKSVLISVSAKKERTKFFNRIEEQTQALKAKIL